MRRLRGLISVVAVALVSGACTALPTSGDVHQFQFETPLREPIRQFGSAPRAGSDPSGLVEDYLRASAAGSYDDFSTARLYLTPEASLAWNPSEQVIIFPTEETPTISLAEEEGSAATVSLTVNTIATLGSDRILEESPKPGVATVTFGLEKNAEGQWRISDLESGILLSRSAFDSSYQAMDLFFPSTDGQVLVADPRWYARNQKQHTQLVQSLLKGPSEQIAPAVNSDVMDGWILPAKGVEITEGTAVVNLVGGGGGKTTDRTLLTWGLTQTLRQAPNVSKVVVELNSVAQPTDPMPAEPDFALDQVVGIFEGQVVSGTTTDFNVRVGGDDAGKDPRWPAVGPLTHSPVAWLRGDGVLAVVGPGWQDLREVVIPAPSPPSVDRFDNVWLIGDGGEETRELYVVAPGKEPHAIGLPAGAEGTPHLVALSPDGARIALVTDSSKGRTLWLGTIVQGGVDQDIGVAQLRAVEGDAVRIQDVAWNGSEKLEVLVGDPREGDMRVQVLSIGMWREEFPAPKGVNHITAGGLASFVLVQNKDQMAYQRSGASWFEVGDTLADISFAG